MFWTTGSLIIRIYFQRACFNNKLLRAQNFSMSTARSADMAAYNLQVFWQILIKNVLALFFFSDIQL